MKTHRWFIRNRFTSIVRVATAGALLSAAAAMAFIAGSDRLITLGRLSSQLSQDREAKGKIAGDSDAGTQKRPHCTGRRPGRRLRGVQIRRANLPGQ